MYCHKIELNKETGWKFTLPDDAGKALPRVEVEINGGKKLTEYPYIYWESSLFSESKLCPLVKKRINEVFFYSQLWTSQTLISNVSSYIKDYSLSIFSIFIFTSTPFTSKF